MADDEGLKTKTPIRPSSRVLPLIYTLSSAHLGFSWRRDNACAMSNTEQAAVQSGRQGDFLPPSRARRVGQPAWFRIPRADSPTLRQWPPDNSNSSAPQPPPRTHSCGDSPANHDLLLARELK